MTARPLTAVRSTHLRIARRGGILILATAMAVLLASPPAGADSPSDGRATYVSGNTTTCAGVNLASDTQVGSSGDGNASDGNVAGVVSTNSGSVRTGQGEEVDVTLTGADIVIDAVVVKGGNGYNVYSNPTVLPPALQTPQHYISPLNNGGNVPTISHWFVCYHAGGSGVPIGAFGLIGVSGAAAAAFGLVTWRSRRRTMRAAA